MKGGKDKDLLANYSAHSVRVSGKRKSKPSACFRALRSLTIHEEYSYVIFLKVCPPNLFSIVFRISFNPYDTNIKK